MFIFVKYSNLVKETPFKIKYYLKSLPPHSYFEYNYFKGLLMGIWNGSRSFGDSMGMVLGDAAILRLNFSWYWTLMLLGGIALLMSYMIYEFATETPSSKCLATIVEDDFEDCSIMNPSYFRKSPV